MLSVKDEVKYKVGQRNNRQPACAVLWLGFAQATRCRVINSQSRPREMIKSDGKKWYTFERTALSGSQSGCQQIDIVVQQICIQNFPRPEAARRLKSLKF